MSVSFEKSGSTLSANAAGSPRTSRARTGASPAAKIAAAGLVAVLLAQYLAGFFFLWSLRLNVRQASPLTVMRYGYWYGGQASVRRRLEACSFLALCLVVLSALAVVWPRRKSLHGDARFATRREVLEAGLLDGDGILLGRLGGVGPFGGKFLTLPGQQGLALSAHPRAGKGVGVVIPNLLTWPGSVVCVDIKKENWQLTAGYRRRAGQKTFLFDPLSPSGRTARWNPLDYVAEAPGQQVSDLQLIANMFFPDPPNSDPFWMSSARSLFLGIALYLFATPSLSRTIGEILRQGLADDEEGFGHKWRRVIQGRMSGSQPLSEECVRALYDVIDLAPQTTSSIRKTFTSRLDLWANPVLDAATSASDFDLRKLRSEPMSVYQGVAPKDVHRLQPLLNLFFQQAIALQTDQLPEQNPALKYQVLMLLDEFPAIGRIPILAEASGFLPGYNVRPLLIMQTPAQLRQVYGEDGARTLLKTLAARIYFQPKDMEDAEEISRELGFTTVKVKTHSKPVWELSNGKTGRHRSVSVSEQRRPLMLPQEVRTLGKDREIVFTEDTPPILCRKIRYYRVAALRDRIRKPPLVPAIELRRDGALPDREGAAEPVDRGHSPDASLTDSPSDVRGPESPADGAGSAPRPEARVEAEDPIEALTLDDFEADFSRVEIPEHDGPLTKEEMQTAVASFLETLEIGAPHGR
jgi:type IV secretion system protein VirD4